MRRGCDIPAAATPLRCKVSYPGAVLDADSFLMKGEEVLARTRWGGNPAMAVT